MACVASDGMDRGCVGGLGEGVVDDEEDGGGGEQGLRQSKIPECIEKCMEKSGVIACSSRSKKIQPSAGLTS